MTVYLDYFGRQQPPFSITPDPGYVYLSRRHEDALAHLLYGIGRGGSGGFVQLTGEVGTGKTTLCRCLLEQIPEHTQIALILNPMLSPRDLLQAICDELGIDYQRDFSSRELVNALNAFLLQAHARGERVVLVIDEAQNLQPEALEQVRLLTNLETNTDKLLQIILLGQPELRELLASAGLRQLAQRITARYHLQPLDADETVAYVKHRLNVAGRHQPLFTRDGYKALYSLSGGVPRLINIYADRALMGAYARDAEKVTGSIVREACAEVGQLRTHHELHYLLPGVVAASLLLLLVAGWWLRSDSGDTLLADDASDASADVQSGVAVDSVDSAPAESDSAGGSGGSTGDLPDAASASNPNAVAAAVTDAGADYTALPDWINRAASNGIWQRWAQLWRSEAAVLQSVCGEDDADNFNASNNDQRSADTAVPGQAGDENRFFCTTVYGNWGRIRQLQLPVVLLLQTANRMAELPLLIESINNDQALVNNGIESRRVALALLSPLWQNGQFTAVCPGRTNAWKLGDRAAEISTLKQQAAALSLQAYSGAVDRQYDQEFAEWVGRFQLRNGLQVDRVLGPETRLFLCAQAQLLTPPSNATAMQQD